MIAVRFVSPRAPYNSGEIAGFDAETASGLIASGVAVPVEETPAAAPASAPTKRPRSRASRVIQQVSALAPKLP